MIVGARQQTTAAKLALRRQRPGFTLLEMILALAIGLVLMAALYMMLSSQLGQAQSGRDSIEEATLARALLTRIANDILGSLAAYDPRQLPDPSLEAEVLGIATPTFNLGVQGSQDVLILSTGRVPREMLLGQAEGAVSDLRRISYWLVAGKGLARQEVTRITGEDIDIMPPDVPEPERYIVAPEVKSLSFQYWDPETEWQPSWDGTVPGPDGDTPIGPPAAIEIAISVGSPRLLDDGSEAPPRVYRHVVTLPTGNNFSLQTAP